jgi:hypothetical protein
MMRRQANSQSSATHSLSHNFRCTSHAHLNGQVLIEESIRHVNGPPEYNPLGGEGGGGGGGGGGWRGGWVRCNIAKLSMNMRMMRR